MNTMECEYVVLSPEFAEEYLLFLCKLDEQSPYMHYSAGERLTTVHGMRSRIKKMGNQGNSFVVLALGLDNKPVGYFSVNGGNSISSQHSATVAVGVLDGYRRKGIGMGLYRHALLLAVDRGITRYECTVVADNVPAVQYWFFCGFLIAGYLHNRFCYRGSLLDEYVLQKREIM